MQPADAVLGRIDDKANFLQPLAEVGTGFFFVFDNQQTHRTGLWECRRRISLRTLASRPAEEPDAERDRSHDAYDGCQDRQNRNRYGARGLRRTDDRIAQTTSECRTLGSD